MYVGITITKSTPLTVPDGIIRQAVSFCALTWFIIRYIHHRNITFSKNINSIKTKVVLPQS